MAIIQYIKKRFNSSSQVIIDQAIGIINTYAEQGYNLTLRQLYYQFVSRDLIPNNIKSYKRLGSIINDARLAGLIDWESIEDRTRSLRSLAHWATPSDIVAGCAQQFRIDKWASQYQRFRPMVMVEKDALAGVFERVCNELDIPYLSCRGYTSQSEMHETALRFKDIIDDGQQPVILHFGDHDPSGIDMSRDIQDRLNIFGVGDDIDFRRMALNMPQVKRYNPPPNPAKITDSRFKSYEENFGKQSWELDALEPTVLAALVRAEVLELRDEDEWGRAVNLETRYRNELGYCSDNWELIAKAMRKRSNRKKK